MSSPETAPLARLIAEATDTSHLSREEKLSFFFRKMWERFTDGYGADPDDLSEAFEQCGLTEMRTCTSADLANHPSSDAEEGEVALFLNEEGAKVLDCGRAAGGLMALATLKGVSK